MANFGFDQRNGKVDGLHGDDDGALPGAEQPTVAGYLGKVMRSHELDTEVEDAAVTPYSEERG